MIPQTECLKIELLKLVHVTRWTNSTEYQFDANLLEIVSKLVYQLLSVRFNEVFTQKFNQTQLSIPMQDLQIVIIAK